MAKKIKDYYGIECVNLIAEKIDHVFPDFPNEEFRRFLGDRLEPLNFLERQDAFVEAFERFLPEKYETVLDIFAQILWEELTTTDGMYHTGWWLWPIWRYIEKHGVENFERSMAFLHELTKRFTGEFAIRPLIALRPKESLSIIESWTRDSNVHVRRLASEWIRISLPWAKKSLIVLDHFDQYMRILSNLKDDPERFVQKSVGNNLNDLMKHDPEKARTILEEWKSLPLTKHTEWIIRHGERSLRKKKTKL